MSAVTSAINLSRVFLIVTLFTISLNFAYAAPATAESKIEIQRKSIQPPPIPIQTPRPEIINIPVPLIRLEPTLPRPSIRPTPAPSPSPPSPGDSTPPSEPDEPATVYEEPEYNYDQGYDQNYGGGGSYDSPGGNYPDSNNDYNQKPGYTEPAPQPFRGIEGSLLDQQQFEFKPLAELSPSSPQAGNDSERAYEPDQVLVVTANMDGARQLQKAVASAGYRPKSRTNLSQLGFVLTIFRLPAGVSVVDAVAQLKEAYPGFLVSANTRYKPLSTGVNKKNYAKPQINWTTENVKCAGKPRIGLLDSEVDKGHRKIASSNIMTSSVLPSGVSNKKSDHGTAIANLLVGGQQGLLPNAELFAVNVFRSTNGKPDTTTAWVVKAINNLLEKRVAVINLSLGGARDEILENVVKIVTEKQVLLVAAAGNNGPGGKPVYPAAYSEVVAVTAVDAHRMVYSKANRGDYIDIAAPGVDVWSISSGKGRYYTGTSFAVPFVTATLSILRNQYPLESVAQIKSRLGRQTMDLGEEGKDPIYGQGLLNTDGLCRN